MNFEQWIAEISNNAEMIERRANKIRINPEQITEFDCITLKKYIFALEQMYDNIRTVEP